MGKISFKNFVVNVDEYRKKLIKHCQQNFLSIDDNASFDTALNLALELGQTLPDDKIPVQFIDLFGNIVETVIAEKGSKVPQPEGPKLDEDLVDFTGWVCESDLDNIQYPVYCLPTYKPKVDDTGVSPTILVCKFDEETGLSPTLHLSYYKANPQDPTDTTISIDWGDGNKDNLAVTSSPTKDQYIQHTYQTAGKYNIKINCANAMYSCTIRKGFFETQAEKNSILKIYAGEYLAHNSYLFNSYKNMYICTVPLNYSMDYSAYSYFRNNKVTCLYIPDVSKYKGYKPTFTSNSNSVIASAFNLKYLIVKYLGKIGDSASYPFIETSYQLKLLSSFLYNRTQIGCLMRGYNTYTKCLIVPENLVLSEPQFVSGVQKLIINNTKSALTFGGDYFLQELILPQDYEGSLQINGCYALSADSFLDVARKLKDLSNSTPGIIKLGKTVEQQRFAFYKVNSEGEFLGIDVDEGLTVFEYIQSKNWTISFS